MPEDLPKAVLILLWLLTGVIVLGYLIMEHTMLESFVFAFLYYAVPVWLYLNKKKVQE